MLYPAPRPIAMTSLLLLLYPADTPIAITFEAVGFKLSRAPASLPIAITFGASFDRAAFTPAANILEPVLRYPAYEPNTYTLFPLFDQPA